ncbi:MAG: dTDP-4-dehydrorhamnose 3,5-epimerase [Gammaproteobacteria bacterium]|nr:dTDP-4-dehydrorhamnose 3,5-epimerase [Gammaproteobacteria bacterium]
MKFTETSLKGAFVIEPDRIEDERGYFARSYCQSEFSKQGINLDIKQSNISFNKDKGTLRGMHYQEKPHEEAKLVRCTRGSIYDVIIDLRPDSATFKQWFSVELNQKNNKILYIPEGFAHGFQTLQDNSEVFYEMFEFYSPESAKGVRWNDPAFDITWPDKQCVISEKDRSYPDFSI